MGPPQMIRNMFTQAVHNHPQDAKDYSLLRLPPTVVALIIRYIEQPADLARTCRTCRVLYYMTLPKLYTYVSIRSYDHIRYAEHDGRPEGCGMASPFSMALNGLVCRNIAGNVKTFRVHGKWKDYGVKECAQVGRVPDTDMMLNSLVRVAVERMTALERFSWELDTKMLSTVWQGLEQSSVTHLVIKFPSTRNPKPIALAPGIPNLKSLKIYDIDPLCYADDVSLLMLESRKLRELSLCWSPRMREAREPSVTMGSILGRVISSPYRLHLSKIAFRNLYSHNSGGCGQMFDHSSLEELVYIECVTGLGDDAASGFLDPQWRAEEPVEVLKSLRLIRMDQVSRRQVAFLRSITGLEKVYLIGPPKSRKNGINGTATPLPNSPASSISTNSSDCSVASLKDQYIDALTVNHGNTLRHLLLMPQWRLDSDDIAKVVKNCPNLEQLAIGVEFNQFENLRLLVPFLPKLVALRLLANPDDQTFEDKVREMDCNGFHEEKIANRSVNQAFSPMKWIELAGLLFHIGRTEQYTDEEGRLSHRKLVTRSSQDEVGNVEIWAMDSLDI